MFYHVKFGYYHGLMPIEKAYEAKDLEPPAIRQAIERAIFESPGVRGWKQASCELMSHHIYNIMQDYI